MKNAPGFRGLFKYPLSWPVRVLALVLMLLVGVWMLQKHLLYYPEKFALSEWRAANSGLVPWPAGEEMRGLLYEPRGQMRATAVVFHGNAGHAGHRAWMAEALGVLGLRVILAEYPGYGPRDGKLSEESLVSDAVETLARARQQFGGRLLVIGESLGAAVAAGAVSRESEGVAGLMLITPWDKLENVARHHYAWLPVSLLMRDGYDSVRHLSAYAGRSLVVLAEADSIVPASSGKHLFDSLSGPKTLRVIKGGEHNDWPDHVDQAWWASAIETLLAP